MSCYVPVRCPRSLHAYFRAQQSYVREWQKTTARDGTIKPQTILSTLWFVPIWLKYHAVPDILRYAWFIVWVQIVAAYRKYHTWAVLQGAPVNHTLAPAEAERQPNDGLP